MVFRQQAANQEIIKGADRTLVALVKEENADDMFALTHRLVAPKSTQFVLMKILLMMAWHFTMTYVA